MPSGAGLGMLRGSHSTSRSIARPSGSTSPDMLRPAADLALEIIARLAVIAEPGRLRVDLVQLSDGRVHRVEIKGPVGVAHLRKIGLPEDPALDHRHHVEGGADHLLVHAQAVGAGDRETQGAERADHPIFAVDGMGARQQLAGRLPPEHVFARRRYQFVVGLDWPPRTARREAGRRIPLLRRHPLFELCAVESMRVATLDCAAILWRSVHRSSHR